MFRRALPLCLALLHGSHALQLAPRAAAAATVLRGGTPRCSAQRGLTSFDAEETAKRVQRCLAVKEASGLSFDELANELGLTNTYTCQLLLGQAQLKPDTAPKLQALLPGLSEADLTAMQAAPMRGFDEEILKEPNVYRTYEAITHYGNAIKLLINEKFGDGIMSAIDFYMTVGGTVGKMGEKRVVITFNGKFLPFIEQVAADNSAASPEIAE